MTSSEPNQGTSLSAFMDAIALQEQCFEQSLASQQIWSKQFADAQEAKIKAAVQKTTERAAEVNEILKGENSGIAPEVKIEEFNSERGNKQGEPQLQSPSLQFSRSKSGSTSLFQYPEVHKEHRRYSPGDHVSKRDLGNFNNSYTRYDHYKDQQGSSLRENMCPSKDRRLHTYRRSPSTERGWNRERRSPSKYEPHRYCHEDSHSPRSESLRCQSGDSRSRNYRRMSRSPVDGSIPHHRRSIDSRKHRERRGASPLEVARSHDSRRHRGRRGTSPLEIARSHDSRKHRERRDASPLEIARSHDSRKHRERRGASPLEISRSRKNRDYSDEKISESTGKRSRYQSKLTSHRSSSNYAASETLNAKAPCLDSVCVSNLQDHRPSGSPLPPS
ncbi:hypothetical protein REPUB_Repub08aG0210500 [Reevesia pubescens]